MAGTSVWKELSLSGQREKGSAPLPNEVKPKFVTGWTQQCKPYLGVNYG